MQSCSSGAGNSIHWLASFAPPRLLAAAAAAVEAAAGTHALEHCRRGAAPRAATKACVSPATLILAPVAATALLVSTACTQKGG